MVQPFLRNQIRYLCHTAYGPKSQGYGLANPADLDDQIVQHIP